MEKEYELETEVEFYTADYPPDKTYDKNKTLNIDLINMEEEMSEPRYLYVIAKEIRRDWKDPYFGAIPYIDAMHYLGNINDNYGLDSGRSIVQYFLSNAQAWKGETARKIKKELNAMLKNKRIEID